MRTVPTVAIGLALTCASHEPTRTPRVVRPRSPAPTAEAPETRTLHERPLAVAAARSCAWGVSQAGTS